MCTFLSFCTDYEGNVYHLYPDLIPDVAFEGAKIRGRKAEYKFNDIVGMRKVNPHSHTSIVHVFGLSKERLDRDRRLRASRRPVNKWEFSPSVGWKSQKIQWKLRHDWSAPWHTDWHRTFVLGWLNSLEVNTLAMKKKMVELNYLYGSARELVQDEIFRITPLEDISIVSRLEYMRRYRLPLDVMMSLEASLTTEQKSAVLKDTDYREYRARWNVMADRIMIVQPFEVRREAVITKKMFGSRIKDCQLQTVIGSFDEAEFGRLRKSSRVRATTGKTALMLLRHLEYFERMKSWGRTPFNRLVREFTDVSVS
jgi:hypothetical protein